MVVVPADEPDTTPPDEMVATALSELYHVPPDVLSARVMVAPAHTVLLPVIARTVPLVVTVITWVATAVPQLVVTE